MRRWDFNGATKTIAATTAQTLVWSGNDLPARNLVALCLVIQNTGNTLADLTRFRVKAGGQTIVDLTTTQLRAFLEQHSPANSVVATSAAHILIPFFDGREPYEELADRQQAPVGDPLSVEVTTNTGTAAGTAIMGWATTDQPAERFPRYLSQAHQIPQNATNGRLAFNTPGTLRGLCVPLAGVKRLRVVASGEQLWNTTGADTGTASGDMILEANRWSGALASVTSDAWLKFPPAIMARPGSSYVELDTDGTNWVAAGEIAIYDTIPQ